MGKRVPAAAVEAYFFDENRLLRLNPEARTVADSIFGWLISRAGV